MRGSALGMVCGVFLLPCAFALNPALDVSQYAHTSWKNRDGFANGYIHSITQTPDGYLWLGTEIGLLRWDGFGKPVEWRPPGNQHLLSTGINHVLTARDGALWISTAVGLASWKDGRYREYPELAGQYVRRLLEDHEGTIWMGAGTIDSGRLCAVQKGSVRCYGEDGRFGVAVLGLYEDASGSLWVGTLTGLWRWKRGDPKFYPIPGTRRNVQSLIEGDHGVLWIAGGEGLKQLKDERVQAYTLTAGGTFNPTRLFRDREGGLWIGTSDRGIIRTHQGATDLFGPPDGLSGEWVHSIYEDREGNIWVATGSGLDWFREWVYRTPGLFLRLEMEASGCLVPA